MFKKIFITLLFFMFPISCEGLTVTLQWDENVPAVAGYDVHYGDHAVYGGNGAGEGNSPNTVKAKTGTYRGKD